MTGVASRRCHGYCKCTILDQHMESYL